jgi:hypothetical protein
MAARIIIFIALLLFFVPSFILLSLSYVSGSSDPQYLRFVLGIPFMGTYPDAVWPADGRESYESTWCEIVGLVTGGLAVVGLITGKSKYAAIFVGALILCWALTLFRFVVLNARVY